MLVAELATQVGAEVAFSVEWERRGEVEGEEEI